MDSPFRTAPVTASESSLPPPPLYVHYLPKGEIQSAWRSAQVPFRSPRPRKAAKKAGVVYQRRVEAWEGLLNFGAVECGAWFCFVDGSGERHYCQPDLLIHSASSLIVCETKLRWTSDAWWQLRKLYLPVLAKVFPEKKLSALCICRSYDPSIRIPETVELRKAISECTTESFNVILVA